MDRIGRFLDSLSIINIYKELKPDAIIVPETMITGRTVFKTMSPFTDVCKKPHMYFFGPKNMGLEYYYKCFVTGKEGNIVKLLHKFEESHGINYLQKKLELKISTQELEEYLYKYRMKQNQSDHIYNEELFTFCEAAVNPVYDFDGSSVNPYTGKEENPLRYFHKEFKTFEEHFKERVIIYLPGIQNI